MNVKEELKIIKKKYGERFMHLCRELFPTILEKEGVLLDILSSSFATNSNTLYEDIVNNNLENKLKNYIYNKFDDEVQSKELTSKTPYELLEEAGYDLYECKTEDDIQEFKKYYASGERLCTFWGNRLDECVVFFAIKKDVDEIKRENFKNPQREDEYGTSVMSIQFNKYGLCTVSIKNRYNHTVENPDATFGNDLEKIVSGLTNSFKILLREEYGLELNSNNIEKFVIPGYTVANDGRYYKYNMEINGSYYCPGNIVIDQINGLIHKLENKESKILMDYFVLDISRKTIRLYDSKITDGFIHAFRDLEGATIQVERNKKKENKITDERDIKVITISKYKKPPIIIKLNQDNQIIGYRNEELVQVSTGFLNKNTALRELELPNLIGAGPNFLYENRELTFLKLPKLRWCGSYFLGDNKILSTIEVPNIEDIDTGFLYGNNALIYLNCPKLKSVGDEFLQANRVLEEFEAQNLRKIGSKFLWKNKKATKIKCPNLEEIKDDFLVGNEILSEIEFQRLERVGDKFLFNNKKLKKVALLNLRYAGNGFLCTNQSLMRIETPMLPELEERFEEIIMVNKERKINGIILRGIKPITLESIARLDIENELTTSEIGIINRLLVKGRQRGA